VREAAEAGDDVAMASRVVVGPVARVANSVQHISWSASVSL
jgi:hypothetical protein